MPTDHLLADHFLEIRKLIAPSGALRVGLYPGSPNSFIPSAPPAEHRGIGYELGRTLAQRLGVTFEPVIFKMNGDVLTAAKNNQIDFLLANATPVRSVYLAFTEPVLRIDQGYLVTSDSGINNINLIDQKNIKVGVSAGSTSESVLPTLLRHATIIAVKNLNDAVEKMHKAELDAFATNKAILFELSDQLPGSQVLEGAWGLENISIGIPIERKIALPYIQSFVDDIQQSSFIKQAALRAGLRGLTPDS